MEHSFLLTHFGLDMDEKWTFLKSHYYLRICLLLTQTNTLTNHRIYLGGRGVVHRGKTKQPGLGTRYLLGAR